MHYADIMMDNQCYKMHNKIFIYIAIFEDIWSAFVQINKKKNDFFLIAGTSQTKSQITC